MLILEKKLKSKHLNKCLLIKRVSIGQVIIFMFKPLKRLQRNWLELNRYNSIHREGESLARSKQKFVTEQSTVV